MNINNSNSTINRNKTMSKLFGCDLIVISSRGGKRGGAREHCSKKEMDRTLLGRRIQAKSTALVVIFIKTAIYRTSAV